MGRGVKAVLSWEKACTASWFQCKCLGPFLSKAVGKATMELNPLMNLLWKLVNPRKC